MKDQYLRSINICFDIPFPERVSHFQPTAKSIGLINSLLGYENDRAFFIVAPYGSGKSLTASYIGNVIENRKQSKDVLGKIAKRVKKINKVCGSSLQNRLVEDNKGLVIPIIGAVENLPFTIHKALAESFERTGISSKTIGLEKPIQNIADILSLFRRIEKKTEKLGIDSITILWDEFGRHLESIVDNGNSKDLDAVQQLAEYVSRSKLYFTMGLMLHQGLLNYARNVSQTVRNEWKKIEGRFETIQYVDDSKEMYSLIGDVINLIKSDSSDSLNINAYIDFSKQLGLFKEFSDTELFSLFEKANPLNPFALYLLPRVSARVAQNERTLFTFINGIDSKNEIEISNLFDYFAEGMLSDTGIGGTYKQYIETMSAISKVSDDILCVKILKTACLLGLGTKGERVHASKILLGAAVSVRDIKSVNGKIRKLIDKKLLLYRKLSDDISVWHGADIDIRGRLDLEKSKQKVTFNLIDFITDEVPAPHWKPEIYNSKNNIKRYFESIYLSIEKLEELLKVGFQEQLPVGTDGRIYYCITASDDELTQFYKLIDTITFENRIIFAIPNRFYDLFDIALEVKCLNMLMDDAALIHEDPLVLPELQQFSDDARSYLQKMMDKILYPNRKGVRWYSNEGQKTISGKRELKYWLSELMEAAFYRTPNINNELIVRKNPTGVIVNARKKLLMGILERTGLEVLGLVGNKPDMSIFRTVLQHTGLYYKNGDGRWLWALPEQLQDSKLLLIWKEFQDFLTLPSDGPQSFETFFNNLKSAPFGLRNGILPILFAAALKAFPSAISITHKNQYLGDILPSDVEAICRFPEEYQIYVIDMGGGRKEYLEAMNNLFVDNTIEIGYEADLIRGCFDSLEIWKSKLPAAALTTKKLSPKAIKFQRELRALSNPVNMLFINMPKRLGHEIGDLDKLMRTIARCKGELESVSKYYLGQAIDSFFFAIQSTKKVDKRKKLRDNVREWASYFPQLIRKEIRDQVARALITRIEMSYDTDEKLFNSISNLLVGKNIDQWDDSTIPEFYRKIHTIVNLVEETALSYAENIDDDEIKTTISKLAKKRVSVLYSKLVNIVGTDLAIGIIDDIIENDGDIADGDNAGCA
jgi:hypothetical protein